MASQDQARMRAQWLASHAEYAPGSLTIAGFQVMQRWEEAYMAELGGIAAQNGGRVLEIGFGMGISAGYIERAHGVRSHVIVECHPEVVCVALRQCADGVCSGRVVLIHGFWEEVTPCLQSEGFDGILFDSIELDAEPHMFNAYAFFPEAYRLLRRGGVFTYFSDEPRQLSERHVRHLRQAGFSGIEQRVCRVSPPPECRYWAAETIVAPIVTK